MRKLLILAVLLLPVGLKAQESSDSEWLANCRDRSWSNDREQVCDVQVKTMAARSVLNIRPGENGAVAIEAYNGRGIEIHARMQASAYTRSEAAQLLRDINIDTGNTITATGPTTERHHGWSVSFVIYVPRTQDIVADTHNGPIAIKDVVSTMNLSAVNGPISLSGVGGEVHAHAQNGPIHIRLTGNHWVGEGLDAETENGPVALEIPEEYNAQLETGTTNGPVESEFPIQVTLNGRHSFRHFTTKLGTGGALVRAVTTNGPLVLRRP